MSREAETGRFDGAQHEGLNREAAASSASASVLIDRDECPDLLVDAPDEGLLGNELMSPVPTHGRVFFLPGGGL